MCCFSVAVECQQAGMSDIGLMKIMVEKPPNYSCLSLKFPPPPFAVLLVNFTGNIKVDSMSLLTHITINIGPYDL